jgi:phosphoribosylanthranilate isomerase
MNKNKLLLLTSLIIVGYNNQYAQTTNFSPTMPITSYQQILAGIVVTTTPTEIALHKKIKKTDHNIKSKYVKLTRDQALHEIAQIMTKIFDDKDLEHVSIHLQAIKDLCEYLDSFKDRKVIYAINFLFDNQNKTSLKDMLFWITAIKNYELDTAIPMTKAIADKPKNEKLSILMKKIKMPKPETSATIEAA